MKSKLIVGLDEEELAELKQNFVHSLVLRKRLKHVIKKEIESLHSDMRNEDNLSNPNWPILQADRLAQTKALYKVVGWLTDQNNEK